MTTAQTKQSEGPGGDAKGQEEMENRLTSPVLTFDLAAEIERLHQEEHWLKDGRISKTLGVCRNNGFQHRHQPTFRGAVNQK